MRDPLGRLLANWRIRTVLPHVRGRLLDIGCGLNELVRRYGDGVGVDVYSWGNVDVLIDDASRLPFRDSSFDTVTIVAALNHIPNRNEALSEVRRVLRPDGRLVLTMIPPGIARVWHALRRPWDADQKERGMATGERYGLTRDEVRRLLEEQGFTIRTERAFMLGVNRLTVAERAFSACFRTAGQP